MSLLIAILTPALRDVRRQGKKAKCLSNLKQIGQAMSMYLDENDDRYPWAAEMPTIERILAQAEGRQPMPPISVALARQVGGQLEVFQCPADRNVESAGQPWAGQTYFETEQTSYEWRGGQFNGKKRGLDIFTSLVGLRENETPMIYDFEAFHGGPERIGSLQILWADLNVSDDEVAALEDNP